MRVLRRAVATLTDHVHRDAGVLHWDEIQLFPRLAYLARLLATNPCSSPGFTRRSAALGSFSLKRLQLAR